MLRLTVTSELTWNTDTRPAELQAFWDAAYPEIATAADKIRVLERYGYAPLGYFVLPEACWRHACFRPLQAGFADFLSRHDHSEAAAALVAEHEQEVALYEANSTHFSYGVYVAGRGAFTQTSRLSP